MNTNEIIRGFIGTELASRNPKTISDTDQLIEEGIIDSFGIMSLLGFLEKKFAITIGGDELLPENFSSVLAIAALVENKIGKGAMGERC